MLLNANQNGQPRWKQAAEPEVRVVAPAVGSTTEGVQTVANVVFNCAPGRRKEAADTEGRCPSWYPGRMFI